MIFSNAVQCYQKNLYSTSIDGSCDGDFCIIKRVVDHTVTYTQSCVNGATIQTAPACFLDFDDTLHCYCKTDFCNSQNLFYSNFSVLPTIECKKVIDKEYRPASCNKCTWKVHYIKYDGSLSPTNTEETVTCGNSGESGIVNFDLTIPIYDRICPNFFDDACYNCTMNPEHYILYCRCNTPNCNNPEGPLPFPLPPNTISCYVSGYDGDINNAKYDTPELSYFDNYKQLVSNESYYDEGIQCRGHYCFIVPDISPSATKYYKGCISLNEQGDHKLQTCVTGANISSANCSLDSDDGLHCYCKTDFCNTPTMFHTNISILPIIECRSVFLKEYRAAACNKCIWREEYVNSDENLSPTPKREYILCGETGQSAPFNFDPLLTFNERISQNFYENSCYNLTMHPEQYSLYCKCSTANCNNPEGSIPYPISSPVISCYVSGYDSEIHNAKYATVEESHFTVYEKLFINESYYDEGIECRGHFCFVAPHEHEGRTRFYKGCISANEQGDKKIQLGYTYLNDIPYYICNTDFCNLDIETAMAEARNGTLRDNFSKGFGFCICLLFLVIFQFYINFSQ